MKIDWGQVRSYYSIDSSHVDLKRLSIAFDHLTHYRIYRKRVQGLLNKAFGQRDLELLQGFLREMMALSNREGLQTSYEKLHHDMKGRMGEFSLNEKGLEFKGKLNEPLVQQSLLGHSSMAFCLFVLKELWLWLSRDADAYKLHEDLMPRLDLLQQLRENHLEKTESSEAQVLSEFIVAQSSSILGELHRIQDMSLNESMKEDLRKSATQVHGTLNEGLMEVDKRISDALIFISQLNKLKEQSKSFEGKCRRSLEKMNRELESFALLHAGSDHARRGKAVSSSYVEQNVKLNLHYALILLPHSEAFRGKYFSAVEGRLALLAHFAHFLLNFGFGISKKITFPEGTTLECTGLSAFAGSKVDDLVREVRQMVDVDERKNAQFRWNLYLQIELYLRNHCKSEEEKIAILEMKKGLVLQMYQRFSRRAMSSLSSILEGLKKVEGSGNPVYLSKDVLSMMRSLCHAFSQLLDRRSQEARMLYRDQSLDYETMEKLPFSLYRRQSQGAIRLAEDESGKPFFKSLEELLDLAIVFCDRFNERGAHAQQLDAIISQFAPYNGGLLDILDNAEALKGLMESPNVKNQSLNRSRLLQLLQLTRAILSG